MYIHNIYTRHANTNFPSPKARGKSGSHATAHAAPFVFLSVRDDDYDWVEALDPLYTTTAVIYIYNYTVCGKRALAVPFVLGVCVCLD